MRTYARASASAFSIQARYQGCVINRWMTSGRIVNLNKIGPTNFVNTSHAARERAASPLARYITLFQRKYAINFNERSYQTVTNGCHKCSGLGHRTLWSCLDFLRTGLQTCNNIPVYRGRNIPVYFKTNCPSPMNR